MNDLEETFNSKFKSRHFHSLLLGKSYLVIDTILIGLNLMCKIKNKIRTVYKIDATSERIIQIAELIEVLKCQW